MVIDARIPMSGNPINFFDMYTTGVQRGQQQQANALALEQGQTDQKARAAQMLAKGVLSSGDPASAYKMAMDRARQMGMNVEGLPTEWGPDAEMTVRMFAADPAEMTTLQKNLAAAGLEPGSPEYKAAVMSSIGMGPKNDVTKGYRQKDDGTWEFIPGGPADPSVRNALRGPGMTVYDPNTGKRLMTTGEAGEPPIAPTKKTVNDLQGGLVSDYEILNRVNQVAAAAGIGPDGKVPPESEWMFTFIGKYGSDFKAWTEKAGVNLSEEDKKQIQDYTNFRQTTEQLFNVYRKDITGAAAAVAELERLLKAFLNPDLSKSQFEGAYKALMDGTRRSIRLRNKFLRQGIGGLGEEGSEGARQYDRAWAAGMDDEPQARFVDLIQQGMTEEDAYNVMASEGY